MVREGFNLLTIQSSGYRLPVTGYRFPEPKSNGDGGLVGRVSGDRKLQRSWVLSGK